MKNKRAIVAIFLILVLATLTCCLSAQTEPARSSKAVIQTQKEVKSWDQGFEILVKGNSKFVAGTLDAKNFTSRRAELYAGQKPFAIVLTCSDSRVPPELIFDQGLGDIFVIRVAGNVIDPAVLGSIEYGAEHLHAPLLIVLGHEKCGAVTAAVQGGEAPGSIKAIVEEIKPAVEAAKAKNPSDLTEASIDENVRVVIENIEKRSPLLKELIEKGELKVIGAKYFLNTGKVEVLWNN